MAREVIVEAASPQEAIQRAARLLGLSSDGAVAVELEPGRRGLLGLAARPGLYRVSWEDPRPSPAATPNRPAEPDQAVTLGGHERVEFELEPPAESATAPPGRGFDLRVDADGMRATLRLLVPDITAETIRRALAEAGVTHGIDETALEQALAQPSEAAVVIARGTPPEPGADGRLEVLVPLAYEALYVADDDGQVDFRERPDIPFVQEGTPVAVIHPPQQSRPGRDVRGRPLPARPAAPVVVRFREGVKGQPGGDGRVTILAARAGRPVVERYGERVYRIAVLDTHRHLGDVNMATGNVHYPGDIWIEGSVTDGMSVTAGGQVVVTGNVLGGHVAAEGDVEIRGSLVQGRVISGWKILVYRELAPMIPDLRERLRFLAVAESQVRRAASSRKGDLGRFGPGRLLDVLLGTKFSDLVELAGRALDTMDGYLPHVAHDDLLHAFQLGLRRLARRRVADDFDLQGFRRLCDEIEQAAEHEDTAGEVRVRFAHNARIHAAGAVTVLRRGSYFSSIRAGSHVQVYGPVIGGRIEAAQSIQALQAGSEAMPPTELAVEARGSIRIGHAHANVRLQIGSVKRRLEAETTRVHARLRGREMIFH